MNKKKQIESWLNGSLKGNALEDFMKTETFKALQKIDNSARFFKAPHFEEIASQASINSTKKTHQKSNQNFFFYKIASIAALLIIGLFVAFQFFSASTIIINTASNQEEVITLPDLSKVYLNSNSKLSYSDSDFENNRELHLEGEAFFIVEKGDKFIVNTPISQVEVLGTTFNIKSRANFSEVDCYSGKVKVTDHLDNEAILIPLQRFVNFNDTFEVSDFSNNKPGWIGQHKSSFNNTSLYIVLEELAIQYQVKINTKTIDTSVNFSGSFVHGNLENALKSITLPLQIDYIIEQNQVTLQKD